MGQLVNIEAYWENCEFHCPVCGHLIIGATGQTSKCEHLGFIWNEGYIESAPEVVEVLKSLHKPFDEKDIFREEKDGSIICRTCIWEEDFIKRLADDCVVFSFNYVGMACGPSCFTVGIGIFFDLRSDDSED